MKASVNQSTVLSESPGSPLEKAAELNEKLMTAALDQARAAQTYWLGLCRCFHDFMAPSVLALDSLVATETGKWEDLPSEDNLKDYAALWQFNLQMAHQGLIGGLKAMNDYHLRQMHEALAAWLNTALGLAGEDIASFMTRQAQMMDLVVNTYPRAIRAIEPEYGFHFDDGGYSLIAETERFYLYQVLPRHREVKVRKQGKPIIIIPPYVLGANILAFLPDQDRSFVHCFANQGIPTYIRIVKDIQAHPAVQLMTGEDDCLDTRSFCEQLRQRHGRPVTLCGYCQGGFTAVINLLSGELDGLVDALLTCVAPMDGSRSKGLKTFLDKLPGRFKDLQFAIKTLANGNQAVDGRLLSWVYKLKNVAQENPISAFYRDLKLLEKGGGISKSAAAINYWLLYDVADLPLAVTKMSFDSYNIPVAPDGTLPVQLFGRSLNFKRIQEKGLPWLICCAEKDDLVEKEAALAPLDWVKAEVSIFPKGHVGIATSWSLPTSECSLDACFLEFRGPVRYQLDLEAAQKAAQEAPAPAKPAGAKSARPKTSPK